MVRTRGRVTEPGFYNKKPQMYVISKRNKKKKKIIKKINKSDQDLLKDLLIDLNYNIMQHLDQRKKSCHCRGKIMINENQFGLLSSKFNFKSSYQPIERLKSFSNQLIKFQYYTIERFSNAIEFQFRIDEPKIKIHYDSNLHQTRVPSKYRLFYYFKRDNRPRILHRH